MHKLSTVVDLRLYSPNTKRYKTLLSRYKLVILSSVIITFYAGFMNVCKHILTYKICYIVHDHKLLLNNM